MPHLSFARIMFGTSDVVRNDSSLGSSGASARTTFPLPSGSSPDAQMHDGLTLESLLHKAWLALSAKH
jgi:hypothetical protein